MVIGIDASHANKAKRTGVEEYCFQIIEELKKIIPSDTKVILYSNSILIPELAQIPNSWEIKILNWPFKKMWSQLRLAYELGKNPPDIYFSPGQLLPLLAPKNSVVMIHDSAFEAQPRAYRFFGRQYLKWMNRVIVKKSKLILTSTEFNKKEILDFYGQYLENKIQVIPLACDNNKFNINSKRKENIYGRYILSIGRLEEKKNTKRIVEAFEIVKKELPDLKLILVGSAGAGYNEVRLAIDSSVYKNDIILPGFVSLQDLISILIQAQVFVFPSIYEGFGIPILEAMAVGVPVVASRGSALGEVGGEAAVYADPLDIKDIASKIFLLIKDENFRKQQIDLGWQRVKNFSWESTARQTWQVLKNIK